MPVACTYREGKRKVGISKVASFRLLHHKHAQRVLSSEWIGVCQGKGHGYIDECDDRIWEERGKEGGG